MLTLHRTGAQCRSICGHSNVKHEAASAHTFLDRLKIVLNAKERNLKLDPSELGLGEKRQVQKYEKVQMLVASVRCDH